MPNSKQIEDQTYLSHNVRRVPIIRSISTTPDQVIRPMSPLCGSSSLGSQRNSCLDLLDNNSSIDLPSSSRTLYSGPSRLSHKSAIDQYSSSSGYDSSSSSLFHFSGANPNRRSQSAHNYLFMDTNGKDSTKGDVHSRALLRDDNSYSERYSYSEKSLKDEMVRNLDKLEKRISFFREVASELLDEKDKLHDALAKINSFCSTSTLPEGNT